MNHDLPISFTPSALCKGILLCLWLQYFYAPRHAVGGPTDAENPGPFTAGIQLYVPAYRLRENQPFAAFALTRFNNQSARIEPESAAKELLAQPAGPSSGGKTSRLVSLAVYPAWL